MAMYICNKCGKEFKTTQHLNQHLNRKKSCVKSVVSVNPISDLDGNIDNIVETSEIVDGNNDLFFKKSIIELDKNINNNTIIKFLKTYNCLIHLMKDKELILDYKKQIEELQNENTNLKRKLETIYKTISHQS